MNVFILIRFLCLDKNLSKYVLLLYILYSILFIYFFYYFILQLSLQFHFGVGKIGWEKKVMNSSLSDL